MGPKPLAMTLVLTAAKAHNLDAKEDWIWEC